MAASPETLGGAPEAVALLGDEAVLGEVDDLEGVELLEPVPGVLLPRDEPEGVVLEGSC